MGMTLHFDQDETEEIIDSVYAERDKTAALAAALAVQAGYPAWVGPATDALPGWSSVVYISLPTGQVSWHIKDTELPFFERLPRLDDALWDGHTTAEKYERIEKYVRRLR